MRVINLASGSEGNLTYIEGENCKLLLDMGLSCAEVVNRLSLLGVDPQSIDAVLLTHEHSDHIKGVDVFSRKYDKPIYAHYEVWKGLEKKLCKVSLNNRRLFDGEEFPIKNIIVKPFSIPHDVPCFGYSFIENGKKISILTDLGHTNDRILKCVQGSQIVYLESNYDKFLLSKNEHYPLVLKRRIAGPNGHLSNNDSAEFIAKLVLTGTRQIILSHLSRDNNNPDLAYRTVVSDLLKYGIVEGVHVRIDVATQKPGVMFRLN